MYPPKYARSVNNPSLWELQAGKQITMTCVPTHYGEPRGDAGEAERMRQTAGHFHLSRNLRMSAQKIAMAYTEQECMGGRSWTTIKANKRVAEAMALFLNSTYGLLIRIGYGQSTDLGRSPIQVRAIDNHPIPDFASISDAGREARRIAVDNFERLRKLPLERISLSALDDNRAEIDRVVTLMLGLDWNPETENMLAAWRRLMCLQTGGERQQLGNAGPAGPGGDCELIASAPPKHCRLLPAQPYQASGIVGKGLAELRRADKPYPGAGGIRSETHPRPGFFRDAG